eukprot:1136946-Pelagomonas_calceolata.AAC.1
MAPSPAVTFGVTHSLHAALFAPRHHRDDVAKELSMQPQDLELSMGMSGDFELAVGMVISEHVQAMKDFT